MRDRKIQRRLKKMRQERIGTKNQYGIWDPTPFKAVDAIIREGGDGARAGSSRTGKEKPGKGETVD